VRAERGKPARGRITIRAAQEADFVYLTFEDDGGGIDREAIRRTLQATTSPDNPLKPLRRSTGAPYANTRIARVSPIID